MAAPMEQESGPSHIDEVPEQLNPMSPYFDPLRALYDKDTPVPVPDAKQFNNVAEFENYLKGKDSKTLQKRKTEEREKLPGIIAVRAAAQAKEAVRKAAIMAKNAGPSVRSKTQERRNRSTTVFTKMRSYENGPLSLLRKCVEERLRVIVVVRAAVAVRSRCRGYVIGFDKHFNMALMDVDEKFIRPASKEKKEQMLDKEASASDKSTTESGGRLSSCESNQSCVKYKDLDYRNINSRDGEKMFDLREKLKYSKLSDRKLQTEPKEKSKGSTLEKCPRDSDSDISKGERSRLKDSQKGHDQRSWSKDFRGSESRNREDQRRLYAASDSDSKFSSSGTDVRSVHSGNPRSASPEVKRSKDFKEHYQNYMSDSNLYVKRQQKRLEEKCSKSDSESTSKSVFKDRQKKAGKDLKLQFQPFWPLYKKWTESRCYAEYEIVTRHVNQLFIRGDNVVSVSIADC